MKKVFVRLLFIKMLLFANVDLFAPVSSTIAISEGYPVDPYKSLILAVGQVETGMDTLAYNPLEEAIGYFQIRPIRLKDYNIRTGSNYTMRDLYDYSISEKIFRYYAIKVGPYDFETIARSWNGSGTMTTDYWNRVKVLL
ncbi:MAG TPA: hypothetical protein VK207_01655 [Bacteroidales bacterium]|nr:hypothetical protein [Bacteroidales bacterium]